MTRDKLKTCEGCRYPTDTLRNYRAYFVGDDDLGDLWLCAICSQTHVANATVRPQDWTTGASTNHIETLQCIAFATNMILDAIMTGRDPRLVVQQRMNHVKEQR